MRGMMGEWGFWLLGGLAVLIGIALMVVVPGALVLAGILLAIGLVWLIVMGIAAAGRGSLHTTSDTEDRRAEHEARQRGK